MILDRRTLLAATVGLVVRPVMGDTPPPTLSLATYERASGGRIGVYCENLVTGARLAWPADERFAMCSTFKASLAAFVLARVERGDDRLETMIPFSAKDLQPYAPVARQHLAQGVSVAACRPHGRSATRPATTEPTPLATSPSPGQRRPGPS